MKTLSIVTAISLAILTGGIAARAQVHRYQINKNNSLIVVQNDLWEPYGFQKALILQAPLVDQGPTVDGLADDPAWAKAASLTVPLAYGPVRKATLKAVYTDKELFLLVSWPDPTKDDQHRPWLWSEALGRYLEGPQVEDSLLVSFEGGCDWSPSLLAGYVYDFDAWRWLAARSNPVGQAVDSDGSVQNRMVPGLGFVKYRSRATKPAWNVKFTDFRKGILTRPWHELKRQYKWAPITKEVFVRYQPDGSPPPAFVQRLEPPAAPPDAGATFSDGKVRLVRTTPPAPQLSPQYQPVRLTGDAGEVAAKGRWQNGRWTVEFRRALATPSRTASDSVFEKVTQFSIHIFDRTERVDEASESGRLYLQFEPASAGKGD